MRKILSIVLALTMLLLFCACGNRPDMPFNGLVKFHDMELTVPDRFVRDSTQSNDGMWIFESDWYTEYIIITAQTSSLAETDPQKQLTEYAELMRSRNAESNIVPFLEGSGVLSTYYFDDKYCQEIFFCHGNEVYAMALRGGTEEAFNEIAGSIKMTAEDTASE